MNERSVEFSSFEEVPHTADWAILARGRDLAELFANAARGMYSLLGDDDAAEETACRAVEVEAASIEGLLVNWLNELLYLTETEHLLFKRFDVRALEAPATTPAAAAYGETPATRLYAEVCGGPVRGQGIRYIKAATYHNLAISRQDGLWVARIVFDV